MIERSIVIPCYNEQSRLPQTLVSVREYISSHDKTTEVLVVDDGSQDGTADCVRKASESDSRIRLISYRPNRGKGYAVRKGFEASRGEVVLFMDADSATPVTESDKFWPDLESGRADMVIGSRKVHGAAITASQKALRKWASEVYSAIARILVVYGAADTQCGFKGFTKDAAKLLSGQLTTASAIFDIEMLAIAARKGMRVKEVPVEWEHDHDSRLTYNLSKSVMIFIELLKLKWRHRIVWPRKIRGVGDGEA